MEERYDIGVDISDGKDKAVATLLEIGEDGKFSFSLPFSLIRLQQYTKQMLAYRVDIGKRRKTTYKTIRRDCAKRNRGK